MSSVYGIKLVGFFSFINKTFLFCISKNINTTTNIIAERAFMDGFIPRLAMAYIVIDKFDTPFPDVKYDIAKSSRDRVNDINAPAKIPF